MAHRKAGGSTKNLSDSKPKYLGVKLFAGERARPGSILVRQRGTRILPGKNVRIGKDHTLFSVADGTVSFKEIRKKRFDGKVLKKKVVEVI